MCYGVEINIEIRPYKTWIVTPLVFCAVRFIITFRWTSANTKRQVALFLLCMPIIAAPLEAMAVLGD